MDGTNRRSSRLLATANSAVRPTHLAVTSGDPSSNQQSASHGQRHRGPKRQPLPDERHTSHNPPVSRQQQPRILHLISAPPALNEMSSAYSSRAIMRFRSPLYPSMSNHANTDGCGDVTADGLAHRMLLVRAGIRGRIALADELLTTTDTDEDTRKRLAGPRDC